MRIETKEGSAGYMQVHGPGYVAPETVTTSTNPDDIPNRFDPYEALDTIIERTEDIEEQLHETSDPLACIGRLADICGEVHALRAYITGMER